MKTFRYTDSKIPAIYGVCHLRSAYAGKPHTLLILVLGFLVPSYVNAQASVERGLATTEYVVEHFLDRKIDRPFDCGAENLIDYLHSKHPRARRERFAGYYINTYRLMIDSHAIQGSPGQCIASRVVVQGRGTIYLPDESSIVNAGFPAVGKLRAYFRTLEEHELAHDKTFRDALEDLRPVIEGIGPTDCDSLGLLVRRVFDVFDAVIKNRHAAYDDETGHGRTTILYSDEVKGLGFSCKAN